MRISGSFMPGPKGQYPWQLCCNLKKYSELDAAWIQNGRVVKRTLWEEKGVGSISILWVSPEGEIPSHGHPTDTEFYIAWDSKKKHLVCKRCKKGGTHSLKNTSKKRWLLVISVKIDQP